MVLDQTEKPVAFLSHQRCIKITQVVRRKLELISYK